MTQTAEFSKRKDEYMNNVLNTIVQPAVARVQSELLDTGRKLVIDSRNILSRRRMVEGVYISNPLIDQLIRA